MARPRLCNRPAAIGRPHRTIDGATVRTVAAAPPMTLTFAGGTLELRGLGPETPPPTPACVWDTRTACYRAPAVAYAAVRRALARAGREVDDRARQYGELAEG